MDVITKKQEMLAVALGSAVGVIISLLFIYIWIGGDLILSICTQEASK